MKLSNFALAAIVAAGMSSAAFADTVYNSTPTATWYFGNNNNYSPANTAVLTSGSDELFLRAHVTHYGAPVSSADGTYAFTSDQFNLPGDSLSFDWGVTNGSARAPAFVGTITVTDLLTGISKSYDPFAAGNDNAIVNGSAENSARLSFAFLFGGDFNPNLDDSYLINLDITSGLASGPQSLSIVAQVGAGAPAAVPEPASWAMMIGGFGLVGAAMRRRKVAVKFA